MTWNLDVPNDRLDFLTRYGTTNGRRLANQLGFRGRGIVALANAVSNYAWNAETAAQCRIRGDIDTALMYERIADRIYKEHLRALGWW